MLPKSHQIFNDLLNKLFKKKYERIFGDALRSYDTKKRSNVYIYNMQNYRKINHRKSVWSFIENKTLKN